MKLRYPFYDRFSPSVPVVALVFPAIAMASLSLYVQRNKIV